MDRIPNSKSIDPFTKALVDCHKKLYQYAVEHGAGKSIPASVYKRTVELTIAEHNITKKILKQNFRSSIAEGCLLKIK